MKPKAILTFDLDFWHSGLFMERYAPPRDQLQSSEDQTEEWTEKILNYLNQKQQLATFFVLGEIAQKYPALIKKISAAGHEIACQV